MIEGPFTLLTIFLICLKFLRVIDWPWGWIVLPVIAGFVISLVLKNTSTEGE